MKDDEKNIDGQSFYAEHLTGSGTITRDGEYADPLPDPTARRGLGGLKTSGGRDVAYGGLGDDSTIANHGEPEDVSDDAPSHAELGDAIGNGPVVAPLNDAKPSNDDAPAKPAPQKRAASGK